MKGILLFILSLFGVLTIGIFLLIYGLVRCICIDLYHIYKEPKLIFSIVWNKGFTSIWFKNLAISIDKMGNVLMYFFGNDTMIKKDSPYKFGNPKENMSSVYGKCKKANTLIWIGDDIADGLDNVDPNHVENAIDNNV